MKKLLLLLAAALGLSANADTIKIPVAYGYGHVERSATDLSPWANYYVSTCSDDVTIKISASREGASPCYPVNMAKEDGTPLRLAPATSETYTIAINGTSNYYISGYTFNAVTTSENVVINDVTLTPNESEHFSAQFQPGNTEAITLVVSTESANATAGLIVLNDFVITLKSIPTPIDGSWYRLKRALNSADQTAGTCITLLNADTKAAANSSAGDIGTLWSVEEVTDKRAANYNYQFFKFVADPNGSGKYAIVCKAFPNGCLNSTPTGATGPGRFAYIENPDALDYGFTLSVNMSNHSVSMAVDGGYINQAGSGQNYGINYYGSGGTPNFVFEEMPTVDAPEFPNQGRWYQLVNNGTNNNRGGRLMSYIVDQNDNKVWSEAPEEIATESSLWRFEWNEYDEAFAMICKTNENGYVNMVPNGNAYSNAYWNYVAGSEGYQSNKYGFLFTQSDEYYKIYSLGSDAANFLNLAVNFRINYYSGSDHNNAVMWTINEFKPNAPTALHEGADAGETVNIHGKENPAIVLTALSNHALWYKWTSANTPAATAEGEAVTDADGFTQHTSTTYTHKIDGVGALQYYSVLHGVKSDVKTINVISDSNVSISEISADAANSSIYDLQGRRLAAPMKGINIIGGRKVLVK